MKNEAGGGGSLQGNELKLDDQCLSSLPGWVVERLGSQRSRLDDLALRVARLPHLEVHGARRAYNRCVDRRCSCSSSATTRLGAFAHCESCASDRGERGAAARRSAFLRVDNNVNAATAVAQTHHKRPAFSR